MRFCKGYTLVLSLVAALLLAVTGFAQETTGGLQGTIKDTSGAVVTGATVTLSSDALIGAKTAKTDSTGYYRFANLPPGTYTITVTAHGFTTLKQSGQVIEVGHLPTADLQLKVGAAEEVVEVTANAATIDTTTTRTMTNITQNVINDVPRGRSFQSVIQFAPSATNEPLAGAAGGTGGTSPGNGGNGNTVGYSIGGGADSENSYLVEGQETASIIGGYSASNVPFEFIQEVQIKTSGIEAEHGGSLGGVINVVTKKGTNQTHGEVFTYYESDALDGSPNAYLRYDPNGVASTITRTDAAAQLYQPTKDHFRIVQPGFTLGGPIIRDRLTYFIGFEPQYTARTRQVNFGGSDGLQTFNQDTQNYFTSARLDATLTSKIRLAGSWVTGYTRRSGAALPDAESIPSQNFLNSSTLSPVTNFTHGIGYSAPNSSYAVHADITLTPAMVLTTRFGYTFQNYHDFGYPTTGDLYNFDVSGIYTCCDKNGNPTGATDALGNSLPASLQQAAGTTNLAYSGVFTFKNANKHHQFDQDFAWFKSGWLGTHNFKFGYQLNHMSNDIVQLGNVPNVLIEPGQEYTPASTTGETNCAPFVAQYGTCEGLYGYINVNDFGTSGQATNYNHGLFAQDAWTIGKGLTLNLGIRGDKEYLPSYASAGIAARPINFGWGDKIAPRLGAAWDVFRDGRMKMFGSYGVFNDVMKLNLAISSFGGQFWRQCIYTLDTADLSSIDAAFVNGRACPSGPVTNEANFASGSTPQGLTFLENTDNRGTEGVIPGIKPYRQHESTFGIDYQLARNWAFEGRWDRRRVDHVIEDAAIYNADSGVETFVNVNPGEGLNSTFNGFSNFLYGSAGPTCDPSVCPMYRASRRYDGVELRLTKAQSSNWGGMFSYTYSKLRGNYDGLTSTDELDGFGGRNAPNNSRAFDEPYFQSTSHGTSADGILPTDRPNKLKGYGYYRLPWGGRNTTTIGWFQTALQGTPQSTFMDVGYACCSEPIFPQYVEGRGKWANVSLDPNTGNITLNGVSTYRTPWFTQSDVQVSHEIKVNKNNESQVLGFEMNVTNLFNQRAITAYWDGMNSLVSTRALYPGNHFIVSDGQYQAYMSPYDWVSTFNNNQLDTFDSNGNPITLNRPVIASSWYGKPYLFQQSRAIRFQVRFTF